MCALTQHSYAMPGSNPWIWISVVLVLMLGTLTSWICPSDSADVVHDKSYPLMILLSLGIDHFIITEVESAHVIMMEISCAGCEFIASCPLCVTLCHWSSIQASILPWTSLLDPLLSLILSSKSLHTVNSMCMHMHAWNITYA